MSGEIGDDDVRLLREIRAENARDELANTVCFRISQEGGFGPMARAAYERWKSAWTEWKDATQ